MDTLYQKNADVSVLVKIYPKGDCSRFVTNPEHFDIWIHFAIYTQIANLKKKSQIGQVLGDFKFLESEVNFLFSNECSFHDSIMYNNLII